MQKFDLTEIETKDLLNAISDKSREMKRGDLLIYETDEPRDTDRHRERFGIARQAARFGFTPVSKPKRRVDRSIIKSFGNYGVGLGDIRQWQFMLQKL